MGTDVCLLIWVLYGESTLSCALKFDKTKHDEDIATYWQEPENKAKLKAMLPLHVREEGPIIKVERLFAVQVVD